MVTEFHVKRDAILSNLAIVRERAGDAHLFVVVKGNGYGLGLVPYACLLQEAGVTAFAVTEPEDVVALREAGITDEILMLRSTALPEELKVLIQNNAILTIGSHETAVVANGIAEQLDISPAVHLKVDTGMGRYGFGLQETDQLLSVFSYLSSLRITGMYTHLNRAFSSRKKTLAQIAAFRGVVQAIRDAGFDPGMVHFANSSTLFRLHIDLGDAVRIGSALIGRLPFHGHKLTRVGTLETRVCELRWLPRGATVGYGGVYRAKHPVRIAILPVGYHHGFGVEKIRDTYRFRDGLLYLAQDLKRTLTHEHLTVFIDGKPARVLGHVGMLHTVCDVTDLPCEIGDTAEVPISPLYLSPEVSRVYDA